MTLDILQVGIIIYK